MASLQGLHSMSHTCDVWLITKHLKTLTRLQASCTNVHVTMTYRTGGISTLLSSFVPSSSSCVVVLRLSLPLKLRVSDVDYRIQGSVVRRVNPWTWWHHFIESVETQGPRQGRCWCQRVTKRKYLNYWDTMLLLLQHQAVVLVLLRLWKDYEEMRWWCDAS